MRGSPVPDSSNSYTRGVEPPHTSVLAPYDGSALAQTAVKRAAGVANGSEVIVVTVVPEDRPFALERG